MLSFLLVAVKRSDIKEAVSGELVEYPRLIAVRRLALVLKLMVGECSSNDIMCLQGVKVSRKHKRLRICS